MPIFLTGYDTSAGRGIITDVALNTIQRAIIQTNFADKNSTLNGVDVGNATNPAVALLTTTTAEEMNVPPLIYPMLVTMDGASNRRSKSYVVVDIRPFLSGQQLAPGGSLNIRQKDNYNFFVANAILTASWIKENKRNSFKFLGSAPLAVYANLISQTIERRFSIDPLEQMKIAIISAAFYINLFNEKSVILENELVGVTRNINSTLKAPSELIYEVLEALEPMKSLEDLIENIKKIVDNPRLDTLNLGTLVTIVNTMWYGPYAKELIVASLEHPPTWVTILYSAYTDRTMKNSGVAKVADRFKGSRGGDDFVRNMKVLVANAKTEV